MQRPVLLTRPRPARSTLPRQLIESPDIDHPCTSSRAKTSMSAMLWLAGVTSGAWA
jgi:hypothetical protein